MIKIIFAILIIAIISAVAMMIYMRNNREKYILDGPGMFNTREGEVESVIYSCGGGMENESVHYQLTRTEDGCSLFEYEIKYSSSPDPISGSVNLDYDAFTEIRNICRETQCLLAMDHRGEPSEVELLDAPTTTVMFILYDGTVCSFNDRYEYPKICNGLFYMVREELEKFLPADIA